MFTAIYNQFIFKRIVENTKQHVFINSYFSNWDPQNICCFYCLNNESHPFKESKDGKKKLMIQHETLKKILSENLEFQVNI